MALCCMSFRGPLEELATVTTTTQGMMPAYNTHSNARKFQ